MLEEQIRNLTQDEIVDRLHTASLWCKMAGLEGAAEEAMKACGQVENAEYEAVSFALARPYKSARYEQFTEECEAAGLDVFHYEGRGYYKGPAVRSDDGHDVIRATKIKVRMDSMGMGVVVYP